MKKLSRVALKLTTLHFGCVLAEQDRHTSTQVYVHAHNGVAHYRMLLCWLCCTDQAQMLSSKA